MSDSVSLSEKKQNFNELSIGWRTRRKQSLMVCDAERYKKGLHLHTSKKIWF